MNFHRTLTLSTDSAQHARLVQLQRVFVQVCNTITPVVAKTRVWNRVALHHMVYKDVRAAFPELGSQMACNAIYAVSRIARQIYQHPSSPFHLSRYPQGPLPIIRFTDGSPVYFDRHTLSLRGSLLSLFTPDGRTHVAVALADEYGALFARNRLLEATLSRNENSEFVLRLRFDDGDEPLNPPEDLPVAALPSQSIPTYVTVQEAA